jgi:ATP-dependent Lhr-like helicase
LAKKIFSLLDPRIQQELTNLGFIEPSPIQEKSLKRIMKRETLLLIAPTGHGKTEAAFLPLLNRLLTDPPSSKGIQILWITPLKSLNRDILRRLVLIANNLEVKAEVRHGDTSAGARRRQMLDPPLILVTTPETLQAILPGKRIRETLRTVQCVVIDEVHELAASKRGVQLMVALERLQEITQAPFQRIGLSATIGNPPEITKFMSGGKACDFIESTASKGFQFQVDYIPFSYDQQDESPLDGPAKRILELIAEHQSTLIFCNERQTAEALALRLAKIQDSDAGVHHGSLSREARIEAERRFKSGEVPFLVSTSSLELGLDIGSVDLVIQFSSPRQVVRLLQRIGRSGHRIYQDSKGIIIATRFDDINESIILIREALAGHLETPPIHSGALDIIAHQLIGLAIEYKPIHIEQAFKIITRASPYQHLDNHQFLQVIDQLDREGLIRKREDQLSPRRKSYAHYFENLSVIPDIPYHQVINLTTRKPIGRLDAGFSEEYGQRGNILVLRGRPWEVIKQEEDKLYVTPISYTKGKIPRWSGELIPVSFETATQVGRLWKGIADKQEHEEEFNPHVNLNEEGLALIWKTIENQRTHGFLPDDSRIYIEEGYDFVILHTCFGTRVNETLGRLLAALITTQYGIDITFYTDHYRILFRYDRREGLSVSEGIKEGLITTELQHIEELLELILLRSPYFARRFLHIARRFGVISRDADLNSRQLLRIMQYFVGTPIITEALREFFIDKLDLQRTETVLTGIRSKSIQLETIYSKKPSPFARLSLSRFGEFLEPEIPESFIIKQTKRRLLNRQVKLVCLHCGQWTSVRTIKTLKPKPECPKCNSRLIAGVFPTNRELEQAIRRYRAGKKLSPEEKKVLRKGRENANLVLNYGKQALIAMAGRGVGPTVAKRILAACHGREEPTFYKMILEGEKQFIRTREWWANDS